MTHHNVEINVQKCYGNAQRAAIKHADNHLVQYVEGITLTKHASQAIRHAWIEYDGNVVELTLPWHRYDGNEAVYFGKPFDSAEVKEKYKRRNGGTPLILSDDQAKRARKIRNEM